MPPVCGEGRTLRYMQYDIDAFQTILSLLQKGQFLVCPK